MGVPFVGSRAAAFNGDPASLARDNMYVYHFSGHRPSEADLTSDKENHGTLVAGIIALNGPSQYIKLINLKVCFWRISTLWRWHYSYEPGGNQPRVGRKPLVQAF